MKSFPVLCALFFTVPLQLYAQNRVEQWKIYEMVMKGPETGNPFLDVHLSGGFIYRIEVIDTWNMTISPLDDSYTGHCLVELPLKPYVALRIIKRP